MILLLMNIRRIHAPLSLHLLSGLLPFFWYSSSCSKRRPSHNLLQKKRINFLYISAFDRMPFRAITASASSTSPVFTSTPTLYYTGTVFHHTAQCNAETGNCRKSSSLTFGISFQFSLSRRSLKAISRAKLYFSFT